MKLTVELSPEYEQLLRSAAEKQGVDMAEMVRILIEDTQFVYPLPTDPGLRRAEEDYRAGRVITHDEVMRRILTRLKAEIG